MKYQFNPKKIEDIRKKQHMSQMLLANRMGMKHRQQVQSWESGTFVPRVDKLAQLATALQVHPSEFFDMMP